MSDERMFELLAKHAGPADPDSDFEERLFTVLQGELRGRRFPRASLLLAAAVALLGLLGATVVGAGLVQLPIVVVPPAATSSAQPVATPPAAAQTTDRGTMLATHVLHTASLLHDGRVLVTGGEDDAPEVYDPDLRRWTATADMVALRAGHTATVLPDGTVLVVGGAAHDMQPAHASAEIYDPVQDTWTATGNMVSPRVHHTSTLLRDGRVLVVGGEDRFSGNIDASAEIYDPATGLWTATGDLSQPRRHHSTTLLENGSVLVAGGTGGHADSAELYDPGRGTWSYTGSMTVARFNHPAVLLPDGTVLVLGGEPTVWEAMAATLVGEIYDPAAGSWTSLPPWRDADLSDRERFPTRFPTRPALVVLGNGKVLVAEAPTVDMWDPVTREWTPAPPLRSPQDWYDYSATLLADGTVLMAGGWEAGDQGERPSSRYERYAPRSD